MKNLMEHSWPGNVRELENLITSFCINAQGEVLTSSDFPTVDIRERETDPDKNADKGDLMASVIDQYFENSDENENLLPSLYEEMERKMIEKAAVKFNNNKSLMAKYLGISRVTLQKKMSSGPQE